MLKFLNYGIFYRKQFQFSPSSSIKLIKTEGQTWVKLGQNRSERRTQKMPIFYSAADDQKTKHDTLPSGRTQAYHGIKLMPRLKK